MLFEFKKKDTKDVDSKLLKTKSGTTMLSQKCAVCSREKSRFIKEQEAIEILNCLVLKHP